MDRLSGTHAAFATALVNTACGTLRGVRSNGVCAFKGISYGEPTGGTGRFRPPRAKEPWTGVRDALALGPMCPQPYGETEVFLRSDVMRLLDGAVDPPPYTMSEDCLVLNVWTPALGESTKRPVMVWLHGGGFTHGSGGAAWYDGENLARRGEVVVVTLNHRLGALGHLYLGAFGDEGFADSGNAGMLDIVAALQWVRGNIEAFGGDPSNVTVFGQSGGACKVYTLMAMPSAKGLFHKAIAQSGVIRTCQPVAGRRMEKARIAALVMGQLGLRPDQIDVLQTVPHTALVNALETVRQTIGDIWGMLVATPVVDGRALPFHPFDPEAPAVSDDVPLLAGSTRHETTMMLSDESFAADEVSLPALMKRYASIDQPTASRVIAAYRDDSPDISPAALLFEFTSDYHFRLDGILAAERKADRARAPVFMYRFDWEPPAFGRRFRAPHGADVPYVFSNLDKAPGFGGNNLEHTLLANNILQSWTAFAAEGDPNHAGLPNWEPYSRPTRGTMIFDDACRIEHDPGKAARQVLRDLVPG